VPVIAGYVAHKICRELRERDGGGPPVVRPAAAPEPEASTGELVSAD
jgi:hypothetical protein